jgi:hypothetical protein
MNHLWSASFLTLCILLFVSFQKKPIGIESDWLPAQNLKIGLICLLHYHWRTGLDHWTGTKLSLGLGFGIFNLALLVWYRLFKRRSIPLVGTSSVSLALLRTVSVSSSFGDQAHLPNAFEVAENISLRTLDTIYCTGHVDVTAEYFSYSNNDDFWCTFTDLSKGLTHRVTHQICIPALITSPCCLTTCLS